MLRNPRFLRCQITIRHQIEAAELAWGPEVPHALGESKCVSSFLYKPCRHAGDTVFCESKRHSKHAPRKAQMRRPPLQRATLTHFLASHLFDKHADARMTRVLRVETAFSRSKLNLRNRIRHAFCGSNCKSRLSSSSQAHWPRPLRPRVLSIRTAFQ